jgi:hypothetical protein
MRTQPARVGLALLRLNGDMSCNDDHGCARRPNLRDLYPRSEAADIGQQFICSGLVDELSIHLVPVMFGGGTRMFENLGEQVRQFEVIEVVPGPTATHLRYLLR